MTHIQRFIDRAGELSPLQGKAIRQISDSFTQTQWQAGEALMAGLLRYAEHAGLGLDDLVTSYLSICDDTRREQLYFARKGEYRLSDVLAAREKVYENESIMRPYMLGLAVTQIFWEHHQQLFDFFSRCMRETRFKHYLEIGPGHGLFLVEAVNHHPDADYTAVDLSQTSIQISRDMLDTFLGEKNPVKLLLKDLFEWSTQDSFDFITVGEVLEHVENPHEMMARIGTFLAPGGHVWVSTCANCPAIDHVYLFESAQHIRDTLTECGYTILDETVVETDTGVRNRQGAPIPTTNYAALLSKD